ncbi:MAG: Mrp/NBP35 family ATP-binding protein [Halobacteriovoraceae bacterium]|nr:Mrp/NBP35 family ATP-binding protein [Halobacteriovoraceae bacterium]MBT5096075.1 Mrp/NBP35 family ATP-binding protein [Halobacteriovoraceae bacterium]
MDGNVSQYQEVLKSVKHPQSGEVFDLSGRLNNVYLDGGNLVVEYDREGISPQQKWTIQEAILDSLKDLIKADKVVIKTKSKNSSDVANSRPAGPANLQVGHGQAAPKKRIPNVKKVIAVSSCKGGVGKSTVTVNLALALRKLGHTVGILDADIYGPSIPMLLGKREAQPSATEAKKIIPLENHSLKFMSFGFFIPEGDPVIWRGPMLNGVLNQFLFDVDWGELDFLLIDMPPGTGDVQLSLVQNTEVDGAIVVSTPQDVAVLDSKKGLNMFKKMNVPVLGMVENMSYFAPSDSDKKYHIFGEGGVLKACEELEIPFLGGIPIEMEMREGSDTGNPYMLNSEHENLTGWKAYMDLSQKLDKIL